MAVIINTNIHVRKQSEQNSNNKQYHTYSIEQTILYVEPFMWNYLAITNKRYKRQHEGTKYEGEGTRDSCNVTYKSIYFVFFDSVQLIVDLCCHDNTRPE